MQSDVWIGALITLAGAALGGAISYLLSRQQIKAAREQRQEGERWERARRSWERRFDVYADFLTHARQYRSAIWPPADPGTGLSMSLHEIDDLVRAADTASTLVFLVNESRATQDACIELMLTMGKTSGDLHAHESAPADIQWKDLNQEMSRAMRNFQAAARAELGVEAHEHPSDP